MPTIQYVVNADGRSVVMGQEETEEQRRERLNLAPPGGPPATADRDSEPETGRTVYAHDEKAGKVTVRKRPAVAPEAVAPVVHESPVQKHVRAKKAAKSG